MTVLAFRKRVAALEHGPGGDQDLWRRTFEKMLFAAPPPGEMGERWDVLVFRCCACYPRVRQMFERWAEKEGAIRELALGVLEKADEYAAERAAAGNEIRPWPPTAPSPTEGDER